MRWASLVPIPATSRSRSGSCSMTLGQIRPEDLGQPLGEPVAEAGDEPGAQIALDPLDRGRRQEGDRGRDELPPPASVVPPRALGAEDLAGPHLGQHAHHRRRSAPSLGPQADHRVAGLGVAKDDPLDDARQGRLGAQG